MRRWMHNTHTVVPAQAGTHNTVPLETTHGFPPAGERQGWCSAFFSLAALALISSAQSQPYPARPIRLVVPFAAGGTADVIARSVANEAGAQLGQSFVLDNRGGANGIIGIDIVAKRPRTAEQGPRLRGCDPVVGCARRW